MVDAGKGELQWSERPRDGVFWLFLVPIAAILAIYGLYKLSYPTQSWRQKITITVTTPDGDKSGSAVQAVKWTPNPIFKDGAAFHLSLQGEAVAVEVAPGKFLFALLSGPSGASSEYAGFIALYRFGVAPVGRNEFPWAKANFESVQAARGKGPADLPTALIPMLVRFRDINDPKTVERVDPNNLAEAFGQGVRLARASIEITNDPVTTGIEKRLGWLSGGYPEQRLIPATGGPVGAVPPAHLLTHSSFRRI